MLSPRRSAQIGLGVACLILVSSVAVLVAGAADSADTNENNAVSKVTPAVAVSPVDNSLAAHSNSLPAEQH